MGKEVFVILAAFFVGTAATFFSVPKRELARPKGRSPVNAADLARGVAAAPTKKAAKITTLPYPGNLD